MHGLEFCPQIYRNGNILGLLWTILPEALLVTHVTNSTFAQNQKYSSQTSNKTRNLVKPVNGAATPRPRLISWLPLPWIVATIMMLISKLYESVKIIFSCLWIVATMIFISEIKNIFSCLLGDRGQTAQKVAIC